MGPRPRAAQDPVIVGYVRTPFAKSGEKGYFREVRSDDLGAHVVRTLVERSGVDPGSIEEVVFGSVEQFGEQAHVGRNVAVLAGLPFEVAGLSLERACVTPMSAVQYAALAVQAGCGDLFVAGGTESMTHFALPVVTADTDLDELLSRKGTMLSVMSPNPRVFDRMDPIEAVGGLTAEKLADRCGTGREEQDRWAWISNDRAVAAQAEGRFAGEIVATDGLTPEGAPAAFATDQIPRPGLTMERVRELPTPFRPEGGTVSSAASSKSSDGAAAVLIASRAKADELGLPSLGTIRAQGVAGVDPTLTVYGHVPATRKALARAGLSPSAIDLWEVHEAFSISALVAIEEFGLKEGEVNVNGGACALGHPVGASGARLVGTLALEMARRGAQWGVACMCAGYGQGAAVVIEGPGEL